jgi:hypothetical protein
MANQCRATGERPNGKHCHVRAFWVPWPITRKARNVLTFSTRPTHSGIGLWANRVRARVCIFGLGFYARDDAARNKKRCRKKQGSRTTRKRENRAGEAAHLVGSLHLRGLRPLAKVGGEAESPLGVLDDADDLAPSSQRLLRRVLGHDAPEVLVQVALHFDSTGIDFLPPTVPCRWPIYIATGRVQLQPRGAWALTQTDVVATPDIAGAFMEGELQRRGRGRCKERRKDRRWCLPGLFLCGTLRPEVRGTMEGRAEEEGKCCWVGWWCSDLCAWSTTRGPRGPPFP